MSRATPVVTLVITLAVFAVSCGSDDTTRLASGDSPTAAHEAEEPANTTAAIADETPTADEAPMPVDETPTIDETPMPVEPGGGIGDGAEPLPGTPQPVFDGDWHGAELAETNCPGTSWKRVEASAFSFSVPVDFVDQQAQGIDSEVGSWSNGSGIDLSFDYGWYTGPLDQFPGVQITDIDYGGIGGQLGIVRVAEGDAAPNLVGVYFRRVESDGDQSQALGLNVWFDDTADEIIARCIVGSLEWNYSA